MTSPEPGTIRPVSVRTQVHLLDLASDAVVVRGLEDGAVQFWNRGAEELYGWTRDEALGQDAVRLLGTQSPQPLNAILTELHRDGRWEGELEQTTRDGRHVTVASRWVVQRDAHATPAAIVQIDTDVSDRRRAADELRLRQLLTLAIGEAEGVDPALEAALREVCEFTRWPFGRAWLPDAHGQFLRCSSSWSDPLLGYEQIDPESQTLTYRPGEGLVGRAWSSRQAVWVAELDSGPLGHDTIHMDGARAGLAVPVLAGGEPVGVLEFFVAESRPQNEHLLRCLANVAAQLGTLLRRKLAEAEQGRLLRQVAAAEAKFRRLVETAPDAVVITDGNGHIVLTNTQTEVLFGYASEELLDAPVELLLPEALRSVHQQHRAGYTADPRVRPMGLGLELAARRKDGSEFPVEISLSHMHTDEGVLVTSAIRDIGERKRTEDELRRSADELRKSNAELEQFAYVASHDLQEPLRMVASYTQLLAQRYRGKLDRDADEFIEYAVNGALRMQALILDLLAYSRVGTRGKPFETTDLGAVFDAVHADLTPAMDEAQAVVTRGALPVVKADPEQLHQLLLNLIGNAIKFRRQTPPRVSITAERQQDEWLFSVRDNGIGIAPQYAERIFVLFQRLHTQAEYPGTGIGLAICKKIVERHGGRIWVESDSGPGSIFRFTLPALGPGRAADAVRQR